MEASKKTSDPLEACLQQEFEFFEKNIPQFQETYGEKTYLAIHRQEIIDYGLDRPALDKRISRRYYSSPVLILSVEEYWKFHSTPSFQILRKASPPKDCK